MDKNINNEVNSTGSIRRSIGANNSSSLNQSISRKSIDQENNTNTSRTTVVSKNPLRVLMGKLVFLDLPNSGKLLNQVRECLSCVEVKFADCLSKEVDYVITNKSSSSSSSSSSSTTNENCPSTPNNESPSHNIESGKKSKTSPSALNFLSRSSSLINRTQAILEKASKGSASSATMDVLATAKRLGINVMNVSELDGYIKKYMQKKRSIGGGETNKSLNNSVDDNNKQQPQIQQQLNDSQSSMLLSSKKESPKTVATTSTNSLSQTFAKKSLEKSNTSNAFKLKNPFLKIESVCKQYKPIYQEFNEWHEINLGKIKGTHSPFQAYFSDDNKSSNELSTSSRRRMHSNNNDHDDHKDQTRETVFKSPTAKSKQQQQQQQQKRAKEAAKKLKKSSSTSRNFYAGKAGGTNQAALDLINSKKRTNGYCESCKQRYDNLKQHLTSLQHENFGNNPLNFKEIDEYVEEILNFRQFLIKRGLISQEEEEEERRANELRQQQQQQCDNQMDVNENQNNSTTTTTSLAELKEFAIVFGKKRQSLGLSQNQIAQKINDPLFTETTIERFERLDITPRSGARIKPVLERLINSKEIILRAEKFITPNQDHIESEMNKKRKRVLTLSSHKVDILNDAFNRDPNPNDIRLRELSNQVSLDSDVVRVWFNEKREANATQASQAKSLIKKFKSGYLSKNVMLNLIENQQLNSSLLDDSDLGMNASSSNVLASPQQKQASTHHEDNNSNNMQTTMSTNTMRQQSETTVTNRLVTPAAVKGFTVSDSRLQIAVTATPSPIALSSPSAAVLFNLNSNNSFSMPSTHDNYPNNYQQPQSQHLYLHPHYSNQHNLGKRATGASGNKRRSSTSSRLRASRIDFSSSEVNHSPRSSTTGAASAAAMATSAHTTATEIDDIVAAAFMSDVSYEIVN